MVKPKRRNFAQTMFDTSAPTYDNGGQSDTLVDGAPASAAVTTVFQDDPNIAAAFGASYSIFALGEVGAGHAPSGADVETTMSVATIAVATANLPGNEQLALGFYGEAFGAAGLTTVNLVVAASGVGNVVDETFSTSAAALRYFTDHGLGDLLRDDSQQRRDDFHGRSDRHLG